MDANQAVIPMEKQLKMIADTAPVLIWITGIDKLVYYFNEGWFRFTGRTLKEEQGIGWANGIHPEDRQRAIAAYNTFFDDRQEFKIEFRLKRYDGKYRWILFSGVPRCDEQGLFLGYVGSCMDIDEIFESDRIKSAYISAETFTKEQELNEELAAANEEIAAVNEELAVINEEQSATNAELSDINDALHDSREALTLLNKELEERINSRTRDLAQSEQRIRSLVESAPFPIGVYIGREMRILLANQNILDVWGKGYDVIGKRYADVLPELDNQQIFQQLENVYNTGIPHHSRNQQVDIIVNGTLKSYFFNYSFTPLFDAEGKVYGVMNTAADVTDLYLAKQNVEQNERNLSNMILQAPVAMCILLGQDHTITVANELMLELWGKPAAQVLNKPLFEAMADVREQGLEEIVSKAYHEGKSFKANERPVSLLRNGQYETIYQNFVFEPYKDSNGAILGVIAITIDVTEQVLNRQQIEQREVELREIKSQLEAELEVGRQLQRKKDDFIGIASHELKTPLTTLTAIVQVLERKLKNSTDPFVVGAMDKAGAQVRKMITLIHGFLNISRLESGKMLVEKRKFQLDHMLRDIVDEAQLTAHDHVIKLSGCEEIEVYADQEKIASVVSNLLSNAVKYSPKGKNIEVRCALKEGFVQISVEDEGMGVKEHDQAKLFDRYYRVESTDTRNISGFGIGLYLSAEIIDHHGGKIWVESESDQGSTFHFTLPV